MSFPIVNVCFQLSETAKIGKITIPKGNYIYLKDREILHVWDEEDFRLHAPGIILSAPMSLEEYCQWLDEKC